jgi:hypothetical protein
MVIDIRKRIGRREVIAAGVAGVAAVAAEAIVLPARVAAGNGDPLTIGQVNTGASPTVLNSTSYPALLASTTLGDGVAGKTAGGGSGVYGLATGADGYGVFGRNDVSKTTAYLGGKEAAVEGIADTVAVRAKATAADGAAVYATNDAATTVGMLAGAEAGAAGQSGDPIRPGIMAITSHAHGRALVALNMATATIATLAAGAGVMASAGPEAHALEVHGRAAFGASGVATVAAGKSSVVVATGLVTPESYALATLQQSRKGVYVAAAVPNPAAHKVTVYLNRNVSAATKVAWFVAEPETSVQIPTP